MIRTEEFVEESLEEFFEDADEGGCKNWSFKGRIFECVGGGFVGRFLDGRLEENLRLEKFFKVLSVFSNR